MAKDPSKTEKATPKKLEKTRNEGNVAKSQELTKTINLLGGVVVLSMMIGYIGNLLQDIFRYSFTQSIYFTATPDNIMGLLYKSSYDLARLLLPVFLVIGMATYLILRLQVGKLWTTKVFQFKASRFNPVSGLKRMFLSAQTFVRLGRTLLQAICIGVAPVLVLRAEFSVFGTLFYSEPHEITVYILQVAYKMVKYALVPMCGIAAFDWWYSRWSYSENIKMSKSDVKDEHKQSEGDPIQRNYMRQKMMQMSSRRMLQDVPKADVIITNPVHIAVALRYNSMEAPAPVVVAMGVNTVAEKIKTIARENRIPIRENVSLARALYKQAKVGDAIPEDLFKAVALILAQIWKNKPQNQNRPKS